MSKIEELADVNANLHIGLQKQGSLGLISDVDLRTNKANYMIGFIDGYQKAMDAQKQPPTVQEVKNQMQNDWLYKQKQPAMSLEECKEQLDKIVKRFKKDDYDISDVQNRVSKMLDELYANQFRGAQKWVDGLPTEKKEYLCRIKPIGTDNKHHEVGYFDGERFRFTCEYDGLMMDGEIEWLDILPLPKAP